MCMKYGERLKQARALRSLTQDELAERTNGYVTQGTISKIERGDQDSSTYDTILADALDISGIWLTIEKGEMLPAKDKDYRSLLTIKEEPEPGYPSFSQEEIDLVAEYRKLNGAQKDHIWDTCCMFTQSRNQRKTRVGKTRTST